MSVALQKELSDVKKELQSIRRLVQSLAPHVHVADEWVDFSVLQEREGLTYPTLYKRAEGMMRKKKKVGLQVNLSEYNRTYKQ